MKIDANLKLPSKSSNGDEKSEVQLKGISFQRQSRTEKKRSASPTTRPHTLERSQGDALHSAQPYRSETSSLSSSISSSISSAFSAHNLTLNSSVPNLKYTFSSNGIKRNKSNEFHSASSLVQRSKSLLLSRKNQSFGLTRRTRNHGISSSGLHHNATFDTVLKTSSSSSRAIASESLMLLSRSNWKSDSLKGDNHYNVSGGDSSAKSGKFGKVPSVVSSSASSASSSAGASSYVLNPRIIQFSSSEGLLPKRNHDFNNSSSMPVTSTSDADKRSTGFNRKEKHVTRQVLSERPLHDSSSVATRTSALQMLPTIKATSNNEKEGTKTMCENDYHPQTTLTELLQASGYKAETRKSSEMRDFFIKFTEEHFAAYDAEVVQAIRRNDVVSLRELHRNGKSLQCANRYGESLVHMACRRGHIDTVRFLVGEANVSLRVKDDVGRTPLHDACWSASPNFDLMELLMEHEPDLLLVADNRGHYPFSYARRNHWESWTNFLQQKKDYLKLRTFTEPVVAGEEFSGVIG